MATHSPNIADNIELAPGFRKIVPIGMLIGGTGVIVAASLSYFQFGQTLRRFFFGYLVSYLFFLSITLGGIFFVLLQHLFRSGWSVGVRRIAETIASAVPAMAVLAAPIVMSVMLNNGELYRWAQPTRNVEHEDVAEAKSEPSTMAAAPGTTVGPHAEAGVEKAQSVAESAEPAQETGQIAEHSPHGVLPLTEGILVKRTWLNPIAFIIRLFVYFACWIGLGVGYWKASTDQDGRDDVALTESMQKWSAPCMVLFAVTFTLGAFDLIMSLDPTWFSTMFGVYYFAGSAGAIMATLIIISRLLQSNGRLVNTISTEHYHDLGKLLFAFTFFWGYIAFSQYMLQWYGNIPEEVAWWSRRGGTTVHSQMNGFTWIALLLPSCRLLIPFAGLLSRHVKRNRYVLCFWAVWILVFHWMDMFWLVMPEYDGTFHFGLIEPLCFLGVGGFWLAAVARHAVRHPLRPIHDPRLPESLAFQNI